LAPGGGEGLAWVSACERRGFKSARGVFYKGKKKQDLKGLVLSDLAPGGPCLVFGEEGPSPKWFYLQKEKKVG